MAKPLGLLHSGLGATGINNPQPVGFSFKVSGESTGSEPTMDSGQSRWATKIDSYAKEYKEGEVGTALNVTLSDFINSRCKDDGIEPPTSDQLAEYDRTVKQRI